MWEPPTGKKKAHQAEADAKLIKSDITEVVVKQEQPNSRSADTISFLDGGGGMTDVFQNISNVVESIGNALLENMRSE